MIDYRKLRLHNLKSPAFSHLLLLLYWPVYGLAFLLLEVLRPISACTPMWSVIDNWIPFNEWFMVPYLFWFVFLVGMTVYLLFFDARAFRRFMYFIMATYSTTVVIYLLYPTCQYLRPLVFERDNFMTRIVAAFYQFDSNTNVCPSLHVVGSMAVAFAAWDTPRFKTRAWKTAFFLTALLISISTVFVKQHSIIDVFWGFVLSAVGYTAVYGAPRLEKLVRANLQGI